MCWRFGAVVLNDQNPRFGGKNDRAISTTPTYIMNKQEKIISLLFTSFKRKKLYFSCNKLHSVFKKQNYYSMPSHIPYTTNTSYWSHIPYTTNTSYWWNCKWHTAKQYEENNKLINKVQSHTTTPLLSLLKIWNNSYHLYTQYNISTI